MSDPVELAERRLRVFLVDDHAMFRAGVRAELGAHVDVVGEASTVPEAVTRIAGTEPDVVLLDVHMPDGGGRAVLESMRRSHPQVKFLALSVSDAAEDVIGLIRAGARGYVTKTISPDELADAIRRVAEGDAVFSPRLAGFVLDAFAARPDAPLADPELDQLTNREREVLRLLARGYAYKEIAKELFISIKTVETHVSNVLRKLQMSNRYELSRWAADRRLVVVRDRNSALVFERSRFRSCTPRRVRITDRPQPGRPRGGPRRERVPGTRRIRDVEVLARALICERVRPQRGRASAVVRLGDVDDVIRATGRRCTRPRGPSTAAGRGRAGVPANANALRASG